MEANKNNCYLSMNEFEKECEFSDEFLHECKLGYEKAQLMGKLIDNDLKKEMKKK